MGTHPTRAAAEKQLRAIHAKESVNEQEETINFDLRDIQGKKVVLATFGQDKVGALRLKPYQGSYHILANGKIYTGKNPRDGQLLELKYSNNVKLIKKKHNYKITGKNKKETNTEYLFIVKYK